MNCVGVSFVFTVGVGPEDRRLWESAYLETTVAGCFENLGMNRTPHVSFGGKQKIQYDYPWTFLRQEDTC